MKEKGWSITYGAKGRYNFKGIHTGWYLRRKDAIDDFVHWMGKNWKYWYKKGRRAEKIEIKTIPHTPEKE